jgi:hypothetical protein
MPVQRRFLFHGHAAGVAAHIRRPTEELIPVQAASSLPVTGGRSEMTADGKQQRRYINFDSAYTFADGSYDDQQAAIDVTWRKRSPDSVPATTHVVSEVKGLRILDKVSVGRIRAEMKSHSPSNEHDETPVNPEGCAIERLLVNGVELIVTLNEDFFRNHDTKYKLDKAIQAGDKNASRFCALESAGLMYATLVDKLEWSGKPPEGVKIDRNVVTIPDFGELHLAELFVRPHSRRLTMLRAELGSPTGGHAAAGSIETNGNTWPAAR